MDYIKTPEIILTFLYFINLVELLVYVCSCLHDIFLKVKVAYDTN